jgi:hypothetical protein
MASQSSQSSQPAFDWPTQEKAAEQLGTTVRTIQRLVSERKMASRLQPVPGRKPVVLIDPQDIERILNERRKTVILPAVSNAAGKLQRMDAGSDPFAGLAVHLARIAAAFPAPQPPSPWMTLKEAAAWSKMPKGYLLRRAREGWTAAIDVSNGGSNSRWLFNRDELARSRDR